MSECIFTAAMFYHEVWVRIKKTTTTTGNLSQNGSKSSNQGKEFWNTICFTI